MATLSFDGADDYVAGTGNGTAFDGSTDLSVFALASRRGTPGSYEALIMQPANTTGDPWGWFLAFDNASPKRLTIYNNSSNIYSTTSVGNTDWWILGFTKAAGASAVRFHMYDLGVGTWHHEQGSASYSFLTGTQNWLILGNGTSNGAFTAYPGTGATFAWDSQTFMGLAALWSGVALSDAQVEELSANLQTSDWWNNSGGQPASLTELTSTTLTDLAGLMTWDTPTGATASGTDPSGWTFDGVGNTTTAIGVSEQIKWDIFEPVGASSAEKWDIIAEVGASRALKWDLAEVVGVSEQLKWDLAAEVGTSLGVEWDLAAEVGASSVLKYDVGGGVALSLAMPFDVIAEVGASLAAEYDLAGLVGSGINVVYDITGPVAVSMRMRYDIGIPRSYPLGVRPVEGPRQPGSEIVDDPNWQDPVGGRL